MSKGPKTINNQYDLLNGLGLDPKNLHVVIVGLGKTGLSAARLLHKQGIDFVVTDSRINPPGLSELQIAMPDVQFFLGGFEEKVFSSATHLLVSPGVSPRIPEIEWARGLGKQVLSDIDIFACLAKAPIVAITGANGKSTVTTLVGLMAEKAGKQVRIGGNLGIPALDLLGNDEPDLYVLELSSFQLECTSLLKAAVATVLNISPDHFDRHNDLASYAKAKQRVFNGNGVMVLNGDDVVVREMASADRHCVFFGLSSEQFKYHLNWENGTGWLVIGKDRLITTDQLKICGSHNVSNALAALALGDSVGLPMEAMVKALQDFSGLDHRMQWVAEIDQVQWINDSKATNIGACRAALEGLPGTIILIAGGDAKGADFSDLVPIVEQKVRGAVLMGKDAKSLSETFAEKTKIVRSDDMQEAVNAAREIANPGDTVLLSPACASLDQFACYQERGEKFIQAVERMQS